MKEKKRETLRTRELGTGIAVFKLQVAYCGARVLLSGHFKTPIDGIDCWTVPASHRATVGVEYEFRIQADSDLNIYILSRGHEHNGIQ
jgi:hypothetical protein